MSGSPVSALKRGKGKLGMRGSPGSNGDFYAAQLLQDDDIEGPLVSRKMFDQMRRETLDETISEAGSEDEEEVIPMDEEEAGPSTSVREVGEVDELTLLLSDTPIRKLRVREKEAHRVHRSGDLWTVLRLRQDILGLAKLYSDTGPYRADNKFPMLVSDAHFKLAKAYAELQCITQASEHCNRAFDTMPQFGLAHEQVLAFRQNVNILLGEMLLMASPPKPQAALQYMCAAADVNMSDDIKDPAIRVLAAQCHALMGMSKLQEANATRNARDALEQRLTMLSAKSGELDKKTAEYDRLMLRMRDTRNELSEEQGFESVLIEEARAELSHASDLLMVVIDAEETRLRKKQASTYKEHPIIVTLWRQASEIMFKVSLVEGLARRVTDQLRALGEIISAHETYECVPPSLMARTFKEQGAALVARACAAKDGGGQADLNQALTVYNNLLELQTQRYPDDSAKQATARAETLKLIGNVYVALRQWGRVQEHFKQALDIFITYLGPSSNLVLDLEHRIQEVRSYFDEEDE